MLITIIHYLSAASKVTQQEVSELRKVWIQVPFGFSKIQQVFALYQFWLSDRNKSESSWFIEITALLKKMIKIMIQTEMRSQHLQVQVCSYFSCSTWRVLHSSTRLCSGDKDKQHEQWFIYYNSPWNLLWARLNLTVSRHQPTDQLGKPCFKLKLNFKDSFGSTRTCGSAKRSWVECIISLNVVLLRSRDSFMSWLRDNNWKWKMTS